MSFYKSSGEVVHSMGWSLVSIVSDTIWISESFISNCSAYDLILLLSIHFIVMKAVESPSKEMDKQLVQ